MNDLGIPYIAVELAVTPKENAWCGILRFGGIGDNLIVSSVFPGLRKIWGKLEVITKKPNHVVFENNPFIDKLTVRPEDEPTVDAVQWQRDIQRRAGDFDAFFHLSHSIETMLAYLEGQTAFWWPAKVRRRLCDESYLSLVHDICDLPHDFAPAFYPTQAELTKAYDTKNKVRPIGGGPVIGWILSGSRRDKLYPFSTQAISRLIQELNASVILFGAPIGRDVDLSKEIQRQVNFANSSEKSLFRAITDDVGDWPIRRILTQLSLCDLVISPDTGPAWSVSMLPMPKIVLLSHASPKNITHGWINTTALHADPVRVPCWSCHRLHDDWSTCVKADNIEAAACMADISVQSVIDAARKSLS